MDRRLFTKKALAASAVLQTINFNFSTAANLQNDIVGHGDYKYKIIKDWGFDNKVPVNDCHEMVQDAKGRLILLTNEVKNNIIIFDRSGKIIKTWTLNFPGAHGLTLVTEGSEQFLFISDIEINKVCKTTLDGKVLMTINYPKETNKYNTEKNWKPSEIAVAPNGDIYIADGYGKDYITQYDSKGNLKNIWGGYGSEPDQFKNAHGIALDTRVAGNPMLVVCSRHTNSFKWFTLDGKYLKTVHIPGAYLSRPVIDGDNLYSAVLVSKMPWKSRSGFVVILDKENKLISSPGGTGPDYYDEDKTILAPQVQTNSIFAHPHDVCVDKDKNLYIPQWASDKTYPLKLERV